MSWLNKLCSALGLGSGHAAPEPVGALASHERLAEGNRRAFERIGRLPEIEIVAEERRLAVQVTQILQSLKPLIREGISGLELQEQALQQMHERQLLPALVGFQGYPAAVPVSVNAQLISCPPTDKPLPASALVKVEIVVSSDKGYGVQSWTFATAGATAEQRRLLAGARLALEQGLGQVCAGTPVNAIGAAIQKVLDAQGLSAVAEYCGYAMGRQRIQPPQVLGYRVDGPSEPMRVGQVLNVQVLAKAGTSKIRVLCGGWRVLAQDGNDGVVLSAMVRVTEEGMERLSGLPD